MALVYQAIINLYVMHAPLDAGNPHDTLFHRSHLPIRPTGARLLILKYLEQPIFGLRTPSFREKKDTQSGSTGIDNFCWLLGFAYSYELNS